MAKYHLPRPAPLRTPYSPFRNFNYIRPIFIEGTQEDLRDYQVRIVLNKNNFSLDKCRIDGSDIRFRDETGRILPYWVELWNSSQAIVWCKVPFIPANDMKTIWMIYGNPNANSLSDGSATFDFFDDFEPFSEEWSPYSGNPLLGSGKTFASIWKDGDTYWLYYTRLSDVTICRASSSDGKHFTDDDIHNPVLTKSSSGWDSDAVGVPVVWKEDDTWHMLYRGGYPDGYKVGHATSSDGYTWTKDEINPVFEDLSDWVGGSGIEAWGLIKVNSTYYMYYSNWGTRQIGIATATNPSGPWTKDPNNPILGRDRFCACVFKRNNYFYLIVPHYTHGTDYSELELYRDTNPTFYPGERQFVKIIKRCSASDWDSHDQDTPSVLTSDIYRDSFPDNELWTYYAGESGGWDTGDTGLLIETDIDKALEKPTLSWAKHTYPSYSSDCFIKRDSSIKKYGSVSYNLHDYSPSVATFLMTTDISKSRGVVGAWMRTTVQSSGSSNFRFVIVLYEGQTLSASTILAIVGFNAETGEFCYWDGSFHDTGVSYLSDTWYLFEIAYDCTTNKFNMVVYNDELLEVCRVDNISFSANATVVDQIRLSTTSSFVGDGYVDAFRFRKYASSEPTVII